MISREVRSLIARLVRENFLWGAPPIHGELLILGFTVSQATVSRHMPARSRRPTTIVADLSSQSNHCVRPVFRGAV